ncbi:MAG: cysteine hydrolase [Betaproteobacteria bacterium]|nr:cysteine hydrolase [Betaproteobacteria bacterium]
MKIDRATTALLVIDMQRDFLDARGYAAQAGLDIDMLRGAIPGVARILAAARQAGITIVHTREANAPDLSDVPPAFLEATERTGARVGSPGPLGRLLIRGEHGSGIVDELAPAPDEIVIDKPGFSAFEGTPLGAILFARGIRSLLICGITTEVCVSSTLRTAIDRGFRCTTLRDACASAYPDLHEASMRIIEVEGGVFGRVARVDDAVTALGEG